ncbi:hypothetical protein K438DRAFT_1808794 [Mycena galopus ATCC 62051]|nr:hypothetical protein K438DRAFT_1808794 [Mycena galopus ATCC 62051]
MFLLPFALLLCSPFAAAIHESDVGLIDWHKKLIGNEAAESLLLVPTASNVLAALNATDGSVAWRYVFEAADDIASFHVDGDVVVALSGQGASMLRSFEASTGLISLEKRLDVPTVGPTAIDVVFEPNTGAMFALNTHLITRVGEVQWTWSPADTILTYSKLVHTGAALYAVGFSQQTASLSFAAINPITGAQIHVSWKHLPPSVSSFALAGDSVVWFDPTAQGLGWVQLAPALKNHIKTERTQKWLAVVDVDLRDKETLVGVLANGEAKVLRVHEGVLETLHTFPANDGSEALFAGGLDKAGEPCVARLWTTAANMTSVSIYTPGQDALTATFQLDAYRHGTVSHLAIDGTRLVITTTTGAVQLWERDQLVWGREESLAAIDRAVFVELPLPEHVARVSLEGESFVSRLTRQIADAKDFPKYAAAFAQRFVTGAPLPDEVVVSGHNHTASLARDAFGFKQVLVTATAYGSVFGLDTASGTVLWTRVLGLGWAGDGVGGTVKPLKIYVVDGEGEGKKDVVLIAQRTAENTLVDTVLFRIDPLTGASISPVEENTDRLLEGTDVISGPLTEAFLLPESNVIILIDEFFQINPYPDTEASTALVTRHAPNLYLPFIESFSDGPRVVGHRLTLDPNLSDKYVAHRTWGLRLPPGETVKQVIKPHIGPLASLGKVLGNRTTLYKYLNPRMFVVLTKGTDAVDSPGCGVYVVDGAKGSVLYSAVVPGAGSTDCDVHATLTENWLVYHYYDGDGTREGETKGWRLVTVEFYEGGLDEKTQSSDMSAFSVESMQVEALEQSYIFAHGITAITTTSTKFGITAKDIIVATTNNKIHAIPRRFLNPRRPQGRKPTAEEQQEEQLIPYDVLLPEDPRRTISHVYEVAQTRNIITSPALLESTSLVFAYGLDLFLTRVAPSNTFDILNKNFNKAQLVLTVSGLALGIFIAKPMVRRKRLRERWYN